MQTRKLGYTDLHLTEVGFGAWAIGGGGWEFGWGPQDDEEAIAAMRRAVELGVNWIDTAAIYGLGHSEELVARAFEGRRDEVIIATKCSLVWNAQRRISSSLKADSVLRECDASLKRLKTDRIDLYQIHWPNDEEHIEEGWAAIGQLIDAGKIRYGGVSNFRVEHLERAQKLHPVASLQPPYSMLRRQHEKAEFPYCQANNIGIVAYSPMQSGLLTGKFDINRLAEDDWRRKSKEFMEPNLHINQEFAGRLWDVALKRDKTPAQLAIAWALRREEVTAAIVGARRPSQVDEIVGGAGWKMEPEDLDRIEELLDWRRGKILAEKGFIPVES